jgi:hypothetical protein
MVLSSVKASREWRVPSRPLPDSLHPPKGMSRLLNRGATRTFRMVLEGKATFRLHRKSPKKYSSKTVLAWLVFYYYSDSPDGFWGVTIRLGNVAFPFYAYLYPMVEGMANILHLLYFSLLPIAKHRMSGKR